MNAPTPPSIPPAYRTTLAMIQAALMMGIVVFAGTVWFIQSTRGGEATEGQIQSAVMLSVVHLAVAACAFPTAFILYGAMVGADRKPGRAREETDPLPFLARLQTAVIVRAALLEAPALFGLVICFLYAPAVFQARPVLWLNLLSPALFLAVMALTFPTADRLHGILREHGVKDE